jgi:hypothetical protein
LNLYANGVSAEEGMQPDDFPFYDEPTRRNDEVIGLIDSSFQTLAHPA